jgi:PucR family transcriptional regulator, purine catabolism regulatory protein
MPVSDVTVTVREIWHLALPQGTTLAGGSQALDQRVEWVTALRAAFPLFGSLSSGYLAIARLELARALDARITTNYLLNELHRVKASALVVDEPISTQDALLADELALPAFYLPPGSDLHEVERTALRTLIDHEGQLVRREAEIREQLLRAFGRSGIDSLLEEAATLTKAQVILLDNKQIQIAISGKSITEKVTERAYPIFVAGRALGNLLLRIQSGHQDILEELYARQCADICGIEMVERAARHEAEERLGTELVEQLLSDQFDDQAISARLARLGFTPSPELRYLTVALGILEGPNTRSCEEAAHNLVLLAQRDNARVLITRYHRFVLLFFGMQADLPERRIRQWLQEGLGSATAVCQAGISRSSIGMDGLRQSVRQAIDAWELGQHISTPNGLYYYEELGLYRLLAGLRGHNEMLRFYEDTLGALASYDRLHDAELVHTLEVFFEHNANASQAARALFVHRNTLNYRLQRIVEITGLDLGDPEARLVFQIALKVRQLSS